MHIGKIISVTVAVTVVAVECCSAALAVDDFKKTIAPIFQRRCLSCHNEREQKGDLSLESAKSAFELGYIDRGDAMASHLLEVITPVDGAARMPKNADPLTAEEIAAIRDWIDAGAVWPEGFRITEASVTSFEWWSYQPVVRPVVPELGGVWGRTPIDAFVWRRLSEKGLTPVADADRRTLIRRLTYDLIGLPPTPQQVEAFVKNDRPNAYEELVDSLLASKHYGERWARHWLDVVKYADTCGYDKDKLRPNAWPYRDYVIRSFNDDKPYSQFVQEQIAGDVLFPGEPDGILGLGFIAAGPWDFIGHVEVPESKIDGMVARNLDRDDMVSNTLNTFCSVTVQCARCHNHKFDPITQDHYYGLQAVFAAVDKAPRPYDLDPKVEVDRLEFTAKLDELKKRKAAAAREIADAGGPRLVGLTLQIAELQKQLSVLKSEAFGYHSAISPSKETQKWVEVDLGEPTDVAEIILNPCHDDFGGVGAGFGFPVRFRIEAAVGDEWETVADQTAVDFPNPGLTAYRAFNLDRRVPKVSRIRVTATGLAERKSDFIFALAELQVLTADGTNAALGADVTSQDSIEAPVRWSRNNLTDGEWARPQNPAASAKLAMANAERDTIMQVVVSPERVAHEERLDQEMSATEAKLKALPVGQMVYAATTDFPVQGNFKPTRGKLRPVQVLYRGNVQQPIGPAVPGFLPFGNSAKWQIDDVNDEEQRRAALAKWLTEDRHPLVWRSIVNRIWQYHFGQGIVATPNDFGRMGALPTHPELLDWLATEFRDNGQSLKMLHRLIVTSRVYRLSSESHAGNSAIDGSNQYLWRMNRRRLDAEEIRDSLLAVSGTLNTEMGGPGFYLFKLEKTEHSPHFEYHKFDPRDEASHRRSVYRFIARSQPNPWMTTLDCADSSQSTPRRNETLTSLQALALLNNPFNLVMAERFANRLRDESPDLTLQIQQAVQLIAQRNASAEEVAEMRAYADQHGLENLCRVLFNLSEFVFLD